MRLAECGRVALGGAGGVGVGVWVEGVGVWRGAVGCGGWVLGGSVVE